MNRIHFLLLLLVSFEVILCSCPGNCNGNGKCTNNVCECDANADGLPLYSGSDCSQRVCPMGFSYGVHQVNKYADRTTDSGPIGNKRLLSPAGVLRRMSDNFSYYGRLLFENVRYLTDDSKPTVETYRMLNAKEFEITFSAAFRNLGKAGGIMNVKSKDDKMELGTCKVLGYESTGGSIANTATTLYIRFEFEIMNNYYTPSDYEYEVIQSFNDYSLYEIATPKCDKDKKCELIWPKVDYYLTKSNYIADLITNVRTQAFCCNGKDYKFTLETDTNENFNKIGNIKFTIESSKSGGLTGNEECIAVTTDCNGDDDYKKLPSLVDKIPTVIDNINGYIYIVKNINIKSKDGVKIGIYDCYEITSGLKVGNAIILGKDSSNNVFIFYDFIERDIIDPSEYSLIGNGNNDYSLINGIKIDSNCKSGSCNIIWMGFKSVLKTLSGDKDVKFACKSSSNHTIQEISSKATTTDQSNDIIFTFSGEAIPSVNDYCHLLLDSDGNTEFNLANSDLYNIPYILDSNPIVVNNNKRLFKVFDKTTTFADNKIVQYKCFSLDNNNYLGLADVYYYNVHTYYIYYDFINSNTIPDPSDYRYELYYKYNDLSLINPIKINEKCTAKIDGVEGVEAADAKCEMKWINYKDILEKIGFTGQRDFICVSNKKIETTYKFTPSLVEKDILFKIEDNAAIVPSIGDICYLQATFTGDEITDGSSDYYVRQSIEIDYNRIVYRIKTTLPSAITIPISTITCKDKGKNEELGTATILGEVKGSTGVYNIYYDFLKSNTLPDANSYDFDANTAVKMEDLILFNPIEMTSDSNIVWKGMKKILIDMGFYGEISSLSSPVTVTATFACISPVDGKSTDIKYETTWEKDEKIIDAIFTKQDSQPDPSGKTCLLISKISDTNTPASLENLPNLDGDFVAKINKYRVYKVKNIKFDKDFIGELKCYNKMTNVYLGKAFVMGEKSDEYLIRYEFDNEDGVKIPQPFLYNCIKSKEYTDLSLLFQKTIEDDGKIDFTEENKVITEGGITATFTDQKNYNFGCVNPKTNKLKVYSCLYTLATNTFPNADIKAGYICGILVSTSNLPIDNPMMSDLGKKYLSEPKQSSEWYSKKKSQNVELLYGNIYRVSGVYYDIGESGGLLGCYDGSTTCDAQVLLKKGNYYYIEYGNDCTKTEGETPDVIKYTCYLKYQYNDLSMYTSSGTVTDDILTLKNYGYYLQELGFFDTITETKQYEFYCGTSPTFTIKTGTIKSKIINNYYTEYNSGNVEFTITGADGEKCHLMSLINGYSLYNLNSDFYKMYHKSDDSYSTDPYTKIGDIYKIYNYGLKGGNQGSDLNCFKNDDASKVKAKLLNEVNGYTYIKYDASQADATPKDYRCEIALQHNDLTLYYPTTTDSATTITWTGIADNAVVAGNLKVDKIVKFICGKTDKDSEMSIYTFKVTSTTDNIVFTLEDGRKPTADDICYPLLDKNGNEIDLELSDLYKYLIQKIATSKTPSYTPITSASSVYIVKGVKYDVNKEGGLLKCYDSSGYKCDAKILLKENDYYYIEYGSECITPDQTKYNCYLQYQYNDLSMYNAITSTECAENAECTFTWKNMGYYLQEFDFFTSSLDSLNMVCFNNKITTLQTLITVSVKIDTNPTLPFTPKTLGDINFKSTGDHAVIAGLSCSLLSTFNGKELKLEDSDLKKIHLTSSSSNQWIYKALPSSSITQVAGSVYKVSGIKYDVNKEGGLLECFDNSNAYKCDAKILLKENDYYYIEYGSECKEDVAPNKVYYNCHLKYKYNDLSMYLGIGTVDGCAVGGSDLCTVTWNDIGYYYNQVSNKQRKFQVSCFTNSDVVTYIGDLTEITSDDPANAGNVVITITPSVAITGDCYLVYSFKGSSITKENSDVGKLHLDSENKYSKTIVDKPIVTGGTIYKIPQIMYNIGDAKTATLECSKNADNKEIEIIGSDSNGNYYVDYRDSSLKPSDYHCYIKYIHNDLSLFHPIIITTECTTIGSCEITWSGMGYYAKQMNIDIAVDKEYYFACIKSDKVYIFKGTVTAAVDIKSESDPGNVVFTITNTIALTANDVLYMLVNNNGEDLEIENSDLYKYKLYFILTYFDRTEGQLQSSATKVVASTSIYKVSGLDYNIIQHEMGILDCGNKITAQLLYVDSSDNSYYIKYHSESVKSETDVKDYSCSLRDLNNDLSLVNPVATKAACTAAEFNKDNSLKTAASCTIEWSDIAFYVSKVGFPVDKETTMKFACVDNVNGDGKGKVKQYSFTSTKIENSESLTKESPGDLIFNIDIGSKTVPTTGDKCYALVDMIGNSIDLINTDFKYYNLNSRNKKIEEYNYKSFGVTRKDESVYTVEGGYSVDKAGGIIKCNDIKSGKYLGKGDILGLVSGYSNKYYIRYDFEVPRKSSDIDLEENIVYHHNPSDYKCTVESIRKDLSYYNQPKVENECYGKKGSVDARCSLEWKVPATVLVDMGFMSRNRRRRILNDENNEIILGGNDINNNYGAYVFSYSVNGKGTLSLEIDKNSEVVPADGAKLNPIATTEGPIKAPASENKSNPKELMRELIKNPEMKNKVQNLEIAGSLIVVTNKDGNDEIKTETSKDDKIKKTVDGKVVVIATNKSPTEFELDDEDVKIYKLNLVIGNPVTLIKNGNSVTTAISSISYDKDGKCTIKTIKGIEIEEEEERRRRMLDIKITTPITFTPCGGSNPCNHEYMECSGVGTCDRESGECKCYNGFTGSACERMDCPNKCNNHGKCLFTTELIPSGAKYAGYGGSDDNPTPQSGATKTVYGCKCDSGYRGADCSLKECPSDEKVNTDKDRDCSNYGLCDYSDGSCKCFDGYYGEACQYSIGTA